MSETPATPVAVKQTPTNPNSLKNPAPILAPNAGVPSAVPPAAAAIPPATAAVQPPTATPPIVPPVEDVTVETAEGVEPPTPPVEPPAKKRRTWATMNKEEQVEYMNGLVESLQKKAVTHDLKVVLVPVSGNENPTLEEQRLYHLKRLTQSAAALQELNAKEVVPEGYIALEDLKGKSLVELSELIK